MKPSGSPAKSGMMLEAARRLFAEVGYEAASMDLIAKTAGVSKATLYAHFESKEKLFLEILKAAIGRPEDRDWIPERFEGDAEGALRRLAQGMARFFVDGRGLAVYRLFVVDLHRFPELVARFHAAGPMAMWARVAALLAQMGERGALAIDDPETAADHFLALVQGRLPFDRSIGLPPPPYAEIDRRVESALQFFLRGYAPRNPGGER
jgi:AcrR family transcriptional regulator